MTLKYFLGFLFSSITPPLFSAVLRCATTAPYIPDLSFCDHRLLLYLRGRTTEIAPDSAETFGDSVALRDPEIPVGSTSQVIKLAYRLLARICHPDVAGNR
ncbi:unnamed protein product [Brassica napus]|uniref:(rape) hypothetical protein n=1 Tax=Brassica napus TaxID=3708 RepID=A0A816ZU00_BRANA|nr:unnamed protein product [Brassica napus]